MWIDGNPPCGQETTSMAAGVNWVSDQWTAVMYMYLQSLDPSRWGWEALKAVAYCFFRFCQTNTQFKQPLENPGLVLGLYIWGPMSWDGCYNDGAMDLKKGNQFNYLLRVIPAVAYTLANILAIHPASYLTFDRAFYLNIHVILFEIYIYIYLQPL